MKNVAQDLWEFYSDVPSLACHAAIELDNLIRGKGTGLNAVIQLAEVISQDMALSKSDATGIISSAYLDSATAVALNYAIADYNRSTTPDELHKLITETKEVVQCLRKLVENPKRALEEKPEKVKQLKYFCLALSKRALALEVPQYQEESQHPYRR